MVLNKQDVWERHVRAERGVGVWKLASGSEMLTITHVLRDTLEVELGLVCKNGKKKLGQGESRVSEISATERCVINRVREHMYAHHGLTSRFGRVNSPFCAARRPRILEAC
jgi:hypothetical protein